MGRLVLEHVMQGASLKEHSLILTQIDEGLEHVTCLEDHVVAHQDIFGLEDFRAEDSRNFLLVMQHSVTHFYFVVDLQVDVVELSLQTVDDFDQLRFL